ncbi:MAG: DUF1761 domain-containing protein [Chloroflexus sp.]|uniref:DUF1761 domain-containing protein n=1 Tax=Chloroflexus sp. TaxID=1904827 RepID=UPI0040493DF1
MPTRHAADAHRRRMRFVTPAFEHAHASPAEDLQTMRRSALITFPIMASVFMGGGVIGFGLTAALTATGSVSRLLGLCSLPPAFIIGAMLWLGYASVRPGAHLLKRGGLPLCYIGRRSIGIGSLCAHLDDNIHLSGRCGCAGAQPTGVFANAGSVHRARRRLWYRLPSPGTKWNSCLFTTRKGNRWWVNPDDGPTRVQSFSTVGRVMASSPGLISRQAEIFKNSTLIGSPSSRNYLSLCFCGKCANLWLRPINYWN